MRTLLIAALFALVAAQACQKKEITTEHGYRFINHTNKGGAKPQPGEGVSMQVYVWIADSLFVSTRKNNNGKPSEFNIPEAKELPEKVPPVYDAILLMSAGDSATIYAPIDSMDRQALPEKFKNEKDIRYELVLEKIVTKEEIKAKEAEAQKEMEAEQMRFAEEQKNAPATIARGKNEVAPLMQKTLSDYKAGKLGDRLKKTASGLEYVVLEQGTGAAINDGDRIPTHYYGMLKSNGERFDDSFERGVSVPFGVGQLVPGFNEGMKLLNRGGKAIIFIPSPLGYGEQGAGDRIPPNSDLVFYLEMGQ
jgi:FKBP-type peptidyl-prolyl cis-trans isomerase FkpA